MDQHTPSMSLQMSQLDGRRKESQFTSTESGDVSSLPPEKRGCFRVQLLELLTTLDVSNPRQDVPMRDFLKWRMRCIWFLWRHLGSNHPYTTEFIDTVEREADPHSNGRFIVSGNAIFEALLADFEEGFIFFDQNLE